RRRLMKLPFRYIEAHHRLGLINAGIEDRLMAARRAFAANLPATLRNAVEFYSFSRYNNGATLQDNLLFGRIDHSRAQAGPRIRAVLIDVLNKLDLGTALAAAKVPVTFSVEVPASQQEGEASDERSVDGDKWDVFHARLRAYLQAALGTPQRHLSY